MAADDLSELLDRVRRGRRDSKLLMAAVIVTNVVYGIVAVTRGSNTVAWTGVLIASVAAHALASRIRRHGVALEKKIARHLCSRIASAIDLDRTPSSR